MDLHKLTDAELSALRAAVDAERQRRLTERQFQADADALAARYADATDRRPGDPWVQPTGAYNAYPLGWVAEDGGRMWESLIPSNTRPPGEAEDPQSYRWWKDVTPAEPDEGPDPADPNVPDGPAEWDGRGVSLTAGTVLTYNGQRYEVRQSHTTQPDWTPDVSPSLYKRVI